MNDDHDDEQRLRSLLRQAAPGFDPIELRGVTEPTGPTGPTGPRRPSRGRWLAVAAACAAVLVPAGAITLVAHGSHRTGHRDAGAAVPIDTLAREAPCAATRVGNNSQGQAAIKAFRAIVAVQCDYTSLILADGTQWEVLIRQVSVGGLSELLKALTAPDDHKPLPPHTACAVAAYVPLSFLLTDRAGHFLHPKWPTDECGDPPNAVRAAIEQLVWRTVSITKISPNPLTYVPDECGAQGSSLLPPGQHITHKSATTDRAPITTVCIYRTLDDHGDGQPMDEFSRSSLSDLWRSLTRSLAGRALSGPLPTSDTSCPNQNTYLILHRSDSTKTTIEAGGCWRVVQHGARAAVTGTLAPAARTAIKRALAQAGIY